MSTVYELVKFATETDRELFFDPSVDLEVMDYVSTASDEQEREYQRLLESQYSVTDALAEAGGDQPGPLKKSEFRIPDQTTRQYLSEMETGEIADELHNHPAVTRAVIVSLADAGYRTPGDFFSESADHIDIAKDAGLERDVVAAIAKDFVGGFTTGTEYRDTDGPFADVEFRDSFAGWTLRPVDDNDSAVQWVTEGRFNLTIKSSGSRFSIVVNTPEDEKHPYYRKGREVLLNAEETDVEHVFETAYEWLDEHEIPPIEETDLTDQLYVGPATHDYLVLEYGILSRSELQNFAEGNPEEAKALLQEGALSDVESEG